MTSHWRHRRPLGKTTSGWEYIYYRNYDKDSNHNDVIINHVVLWLRLMLSCRISYENCFKSHTIRWPRLFDRLTMQHFDCCTVCIERKSLEKRTMNKIIYVEGELESTVQDNTEWTVSDNDWSDIWTLPLHPKSIMSRPPWSAHVTNDLRALSGVIERKRKGKRSLFM